MNKSQEYSTAIHEAGHAVMAVLQGKELQNTSIKPNGDILGITNSTFDNRLLNDNSKKALNSKVKICCMELFSGFAAQVVFGIDRKQCNSRSKNDKFELHLIITAYVGDIMYDNYNSFIVHSVFNEFVKPLVQRQIKAVADSLMVHKTLSGEQVIKIMKDVEQQQKYIRLNK